MSMDTLEHLNSPQKEAAAETSQHVRIIAGAGSGKTRVLISRIAYLIEECGIPPYRIMAITFTNKAAREMKERLEAALGKQAADLVRISTIHSLCVRMLREDAVKLGYSKNFTILDTEDQRAILRPFYKALQVDKNKFPYTRTLGYISANKTAMVPPEKAMDMAYNEDQRLQADLYARYAKSVADMKAMDFDDLLVNAYRLLSQNEEVKDKWRKRLDFIHVDEFQDVDELQYNIVKELVGPEAKLCVVGDPDQTIYTWRGADVDIIMNFKDDFPETKTVILNENYRSTKPILMAANSLISHNKARIKKDLFTSAESEDLVEASECPEDSDEAMYIVRRINELHAKGMSYSDMAILYRSNYLSRSLEKGLRAAGIPYTVYGGIRFYERAEIKDMLSYLQLLTMKDEEDGSSLSKNLPLLRIINQPRRGIGARTIEKIQQTAREKGINMYDALFERDSFSKVVSGKLALFTDAVEELKQDLKTESLPDMIDLILDKTGYGDMLRLAKEEERLENIMELRNDIARAQMENPDLTLEEYLQDVSLFTDAIDEAPDNAVTLMTVHASKGLEFDAVFVSNLNDGIFPSQKALDESGTAGLEEERRLLYVAMTRARKNLFLTWNLGYNFNKEKSKVKSRFVQEITPESLKSGQKKETKKPAASISDSFSRHTRRRTQKAMSNRAHFRAGDQIDHKAYGRGIILEIKGNTATVAFDKTIGVKKINTQHTSLTKVQ